MRRRQRSVSGAETRFGAALRAAGLDPTVQHRLGRYTVDFYFPSFGLAVEFDGEYWHALPRVVAKDKRKEQALRKARINLMRVPERLWIDNPSAAVMMVVNAVSEARGAS